MKIVKKCISIIFRVHLKAGWNSQHLPLFKRPTFIFAFAVILKVFLGEFLYHYLSSWALNQNWAGVAISKFLLRSRHCFWPNCGCMYAWMKKNFTLLLPCRSRSGIRSWKNDYQNKFKFLIVSHLKAMLSKALIDITE